jgi:hypothetical protein
MNKKSVNTEVHWHLHKILHKIGSFNFFLARESHSKCDLKMMDGEK